MLTYQQAEQMFREHKPFLAENGVIPLPSVRAYVPDGWKRNFMLAQDAQPSLITDPNSAVPAMLTTLIDPEVYKIVMAPCEMADIFGEQQRGSWLDETNMFPTAERTGYTSSYADFAENGRAGMNVNWPQRQSYLFQVMLEYGEREVERAGLARINWVSELQGAAAWAENNFLNLTYAYGVLGLQNYGLLNDPGLSAALTPAPKAAGGVKWVLNGVINATANEVYADIQSMFIKLVQQSNGVIKAKSKLVLAMSPQSEVALTATNTFNVNVYDLIKKNFPSLEVRTAIQYGAKSSTNPQGNAAGELVQMIAEEAEGQKTGYMSFPVKAKSGPVIQATSSWKQKITAGTWGAIVRQPFGIAQMVGV
jgi:hypothetical protein